MNDQSAIADEDLFSISGSPENLPIFTQTEDGDVEEVTVEQGWLSFLENAPLSTKDWMTAAAAGIVSALAVGIVNFAATAIPQTRPASPPWYPRGHGGGSWVGRLWFGLGS
jgi:twitching motility protein PilJ